MLAAIYALVSTGYVLIYRVSRVLNLAHGELMMIGAYLLVAHRGSLSAVIRCSRCCSPRSCGLVMGMVVYAVLMRWMTGEAVLAAVLITIALGILLRGLTHPDLDDAAILSRRHRSAGTIRRCGFVPRRADFRGEPRDRDV